MQKRHTDRELYFREQGYTTEKYVIPFIEQGYPISPGSSVLEIGCGEGGNITPFLNKGCLVTGIDINEDQIIKAKGFFANHPLQENLTLIANDIYQVTELNHRYDIVILRDVIEHIPDQEYFMSFVKRFLSPGGLLYIGFPPWQNPFGGHQQICRNPILSRSPWIHLLPGNIYSKLLQSGGVEPKEFLDIKKTGLSLEKLKNIIRKENYQIIGEELYIINPNYEIKFGLRPRKLRRIGNIPYIRNFYTTCGYFLLKI